MIVNTVVAYEWGVTWAKAFIHLAYEITFTKLAFHCGLILSLSATGSGFVTVQ